MEYPKISLFPTNQDVDRIQPQTHKSGQVDQIGQGFKEILDSLNQTQANSDQLIQKLSAGEDVDIHQVMTAFEETDINFRVAMTIRDRLVDAYREVTRLQV